VERVATVSKRTLRRDADKYIHFTKRLPLTVEFTPSPDEVGSTTWSTTTCSATSCSPSRVVQRHLSALIIRKRLGSSTYAVASTLENIANRLADEVAAGQRRDGRGGLVAADFADDEITSEELEEAEEIEGTGHRFPARRCRWTNRCWRRCVPRLPSCASTPRLPVRSR
jgi:hypothetical protein